MPFTDRPRFPRNQLRNLAFVVVVGLGLIATSVLSDAVGGAGHVLTGAGARVGATAVALTFNVVVFWTGFRLATASTVTTRELRLGALAAAVACHYLQAQITLLAIEIDMVRARALWPRSLFPPPLTPQDMAAYRLYARVEQRRRGIDIEVDDRAAPGRSPGNWSR